MGLLRGPGSRRLVSAPRSSKVTLPNSLPFLGGDGRFSPILHAGDKESPEPRGRRCPAPAVAAPHAPPGPSLPPPSLCLPLCGEWVYWKLNSPVARDERTRAGLHSLNSVPQWTRAPPALRELCCTELGRGRGSQWAGAFPGRGPSPPLFTTSRGGRLWASGGRGVRASVSEGGARCARRCRYLRSPRVFVPGSLRMTAGPAWPYFSVVGAPRVRSAGQASACGTSVCVGASRRAPAGPAPGNLAAALGSKAGAPACRQQPEQRRRASVPRIPRASAERAECPDQCSAARCPARLEEQRPRL